MRMGLKPVGTAALLLSVLAACTPVTGQTGLIVSVASQGPVDCILVSASRPGGEAVKAPLEVPDPALWREAKHKVLIYAGGALGEGDVVFSVSGHRGGCDTEPVAAGQASATFEQGQVREVPLTLSLDGDDDDGDGYANAHDCAPNDPLVFPSQGDERNRCDGLDNDCDGDVDEGCPCTEPLPCHPMGLGSDLAGVGACVLGKQACVSGRLGGCVGAGMPAPEVCDGVDNDCDGVADPDCPCELGQIRDCYEAGPARVAGVGACVRGTQLCDGRRFGPCTGDVAPSREICNDLDDDCDGQTDEEARQQRCALTEGVCAGATRACKPSGNACLDSDYALAAASRGTIYVDVETALHCDGADNDCDGEIDEGCTCKPGTIEPCHPMGATTPASVTGECRRGSRRCSSDGVWEDCKGYVAPTAELCDGLDNDCDGSVDEDVDGEGDLCATGEPGACAPGVQRCVDASLSCVGVEQASAEACNGLDDDCDGDTDEDFDLLDDPANCGSACLACGAGSACCDGVCTGITSDEANCGACGVACAEGKGCCQGQCFDFAVDNRHCGTCGIACAGGNTCRGGGCVPTRELECHDGDDDHDGLADCADADCAEGVSCSAPDATYAATCQGGVCVADAEWSCSNGQDDDQNGDVDCADEACGEGVVCDANAGTCCGGSCAHEVECGNGLDDDCDGLVDCADPDCAGKGRAEVCNGLDDDCDGAIDEDFRVGEACSEGVGACREVSQIVCISEQTAACKASPGTPSRELCNGLDDDCDGATDEAPECGGPNVDVAEGVATDWTTAESPNNDLAPCRTSGTSAVSLAMATAAGNIKTGTNALRIDYTSQYYFQGVYPANRDANWDLSTRTGVHFWVKAQKPANWSAWDPGGPTIVLCSPGGHAVIRPPDNLLSTTWLEVSLPFTGGNGWTRTEQGNFDPAHVDFIEFHSNPNRNRGTGTANVFLDDVRFY